jgi:hypothetical protein
MLDLGLDGKLMARKLVRTRSLVAQLESAQLVRIFKRAEIRFQLGHITSQLDLARKPNWANLTYQLSEILWWNVKCCCMECFFIFVGELNLWWFLNVKCWHVVLHYCCMVAWSHGVFCYWMNLTLIVSFMIGYIICALFLFFLLLEII